MRSCFSLAGAGGTHQLAVGKASNRAAIGVGTDANGGARDIVALAIDGRHLNGEWLILLAADDDSGIAIQLGAEEARRLPQLEQGLVIRSRLSLLLRMGLYSRGA